MLGCIFFLSWFFFFFNDTATTEIYTLSLHDALPIPGVGCHGRAFYWRVSDIEREKDRKSTRLNSSHPSISYAVFCLKKKKKKITDISVIKKKLKNIKIKEVCSCISFIYFFFL